MTNRSMMWSMGLSGWLLTLVSVLIAAVLINYIFFSLFLEARSPEVT